MKKVSAADLAINGGSPLFDSILSTSNLVLPSQEIFFERLQNSISSSGLTSNGPCVEEFEALIAQRYGVKHCIATCNGLWALAVCIRCIRLEGKSEIVMPSLTYRRMADIAAWVSMTPHFCDVEMTTRGVSAAKIEPCLNENTGLILAAHPIVDLCDIDSIVGLARERNIPLLFDSVEAAYATHGGKMIGGFGEAECFSMHASKFLNGFEAGYITTNSDSLAHDLRVMIDQEVPRESESSAFGINGRLCEAHAALAIASIYDLEDQIERNRGRYFAYKNLLSGIKGLRLVKYDEQQVRTFKNILVELTEDWSLDRAQTIELLHAENLLVRPYYSPPLHKKEYSFDVKTNIQSNTEFLGDRYLLLPCGDFVSESDVAEICELLNFISNTRDLIGAEL